MSFNICSLSGNIIEEPVVSKTTGHIYEKRIIEKYLTNFGKCPVTSNPMSADDLIKVNTQLFSKPKTTKENSLPGLFSNLEAQMENVLGETYQLKQKVDSGREELTHSLYQYDASLRVISKLIKERDSIIQEINNLKYEYEDLEIEAFVNEEKENSGIYEKLLDRINELAMILTQMRKERKMPENYPNFTAESRDKLKSFKYTPALVKEFSSKAENGSKGEMPKLSCFDLNNYFADPYYLVSGFSNGNVVLSSFDKNEFSTIIEEETEIDNNEIAKRCFKDIFTYKNHKSEITALEFYPNETIFGFVVCSKDNNGTFIVGNVEEQTPKFSERYKITSHMKPLTSCSFHPLKEYAAFGSLDNYWSFHNILKGVQLMRKETDSAINVIKFHPDGLILGTGHNHGLISLWDMNTQEIAINLNTNDPNGVSKISFSENGYYFASASKSSNSVNLWDLRKQKVIREIKLPENSLIEDIQFDNFGNSLGICAENSYIYNVKSSELISQIDSNLNCNYIRFDREMEFFMTSNIDGNISTNLIFN